MKTSFYPTRVLLRAVKASAVTEGVSLRVVLVRAVEAYLARPTQKETDR